MSDEILTAMRVINAAQKRVWDLHFAIKPLNEPLAMEVWEQALQIEHGLKVLNKCLFQKDEYFEG